MNEYKGLTTTSILWERCMLISIAHAIMVAYYPELSFEHSWDGDNYSIQDNEGIRGTLSFSNESCVAAFRNDKSIRLIGTREAKQYLLGAPSSIIELAQKETFEYLYEEVNGVSIPSITTAFWCDEKSLYSNDDLNEMFENGVKIIENHLKGVDQLIAYCKSYYEMNSHQEKLMHEIYSRKLHAKDKVLKLSAKILSLTEDDDLQECMDSFREIGIVFDE